MRRSSMVDFLFGMVDSDAPYNCQQSTVNSQLPTANTFRNISDRKLFSTAQSRRNIKKLSCLSSPSGEMISSAASRQFHRN
ncbi:MAG: hypothetical protein HC789_22885 [Microcoleus sp. CSU_2_2]|nr:hypothetical protein [Microcoleus sp. CSU_2_2]